MRPHDASGCFNPSVGILFIQAYVPDTYADVVGRFQSLGRDSVHSSGAESGYGRPLSLVSIPRSGFCSFKPIAIALIMNVEQCFNPSVGILFIQAPFKSFGREHSAVFQSLGRDSVHSSSTGRVSKTRIHSQFQSLGRDSVHSSFRGRFWQPGDRQVSIPRSGFCSFKRKTWVK